MPSDLACQDVSKRFGRFLAVDGVSFSVPGGSFFSILGPSGCGKTTLMRMIAGFEDPSGGDIRIDGRSVVDTPPNRRNVKMVFQHLALFPMMNVGENIAYGLRCRGMGREEIRRRVAAVLDRIGLPGVAEKQVHQLSGGQKQRIAIARCMVLEPDVLLLDEPLGALDLKLRERMKIELKLLQHQFNTTFLYITHDQSEALVMSDRVAVMNHGRFEQIGTPQDLYHAPVTAFVAGFVGDTNRWDAAVVRTEGDRIAFATTSGDAMLGRWAEPSRRPAVGDRIAVFVRPEAIEVRRGAAGTVDGGEVNRLSGTVESILFNGAASRLLVRTAAGHIVEADLPQSGAAAGIAQGEAVEVAWPAERARCFLAGAGVP
ncbi:ABC transporter ATP-binding protein [Prosthecomicrobium hirschii]|uniref:ABC transporter ATP-binding protein n=1 Tax=Prosthecodimorpha hirschii TaxID=665126 RepID=UPI0011280621|nr:ABC transporter ATP-binding protein [Prosthecomicrobium hirschii]TPQ47013.1 ABC transporter ATP-binding protein [Prosthecomicrobium hirschii]